MSANESTELRHGTMGVAEIVFLVIAYAAPLAAMVSYAALAIGFGDGIGAPGAWVLGGIALALFAVGYAAMSRYITNAGAFYAYIAAGLGRPLGIGAGFVAIVAYNSLVITIAGLFGYFAHSTLQTELSISINWIPLAFAGLAIAGLLAYRGIEASVKTLGVLLGLETLLLLAFDVAVLIKAGPGAYTLQSFNPANVFSGHIGVGFTFVFATFIGFEATAIFGEEAREPKKTVPRATYVAIAIIAVLYAFSSWSAIAGLGAKGALKTATTNPGNYMGIVMHRYLGAFGTHALDILILTSLFAVLLASHNGTTRYLYAFSRERLLPRALERTHPRYRSPYVAGFVQLGLTAIVVGIYAIAGANPLTGLAATFTGIGTLGIIALMSGTSAAVIGYFRSHHRGQVGPWTAIIAPALGCAALACVSVLIVENMSDITGSSSTLNGLLPLVLLIALVVGIVVGSVRKAEVALDQADDADTGSPAAGPSSAPTPVGVGSSVGG